MKMKILFLICFMLTSFAIANQMCTDCEYQATPCDDSGDHYSCARRYTFAMPLCSAKDVSDCSSPAVSNGMSSIEDVDGSGSATNPTTFCAGQYCSPTNEYSCHGVSDGGVCLGSPSILHVCDHGQCYVYPW